MADTSMNSDLKFTPSVSEKPVMQAQSDSQRQSVKADSSTIPSIPSECDTASRVVSQLDRLTCALQTESANGCASNAEHLSPDNIYE
jgi:hypothetical protein